MWDAGIDCADEHHVVVVLDEKGKPLATKQFPHTVDGLAQLTASLVSMVGAVEHKEELACILETSHGLLIAALLEAGLPVYPVNPKTVDRHRKPGFRQNRCHCCLSAGTDRAQ
jgi:hypothetical protein